MGFDRNQLVESLRNRIQNEVALLIRLILLRNLKYFLASY